MQIIIEDREGLERLRGIVSEGAFKAISKSYEHEREKGCYLLDSQLAVVFAEKIDDIREGEAVWAHEQAHYVFEQLSEEEQARYGTKCLQWIKHNAPEVYENIVDNYPQSEWHTEACAYTISEMVMGQGFDNFMQSSLSGEEDIVKFATFYRNTISHGKSERQESASNRLQQPAAQTSSDFSGPRDTERQAESRDSGEGERRNRYVGGNGSDIEELFKDQSLGLQERITLAKLRLAAAHAAVEE